MTDSKDLQVDTRDGAEPDALNLVVPNEEFELVDARRNVAEREDVAPDGGKLFAEASNEIYVYGN